MPSQPGENRGERLGEFESRSVKTREAVEGFHLLENFHKLCRGVSTGGLVSGFRTFDLKNYAHQLKVLQILLFINQFIFNWPKAF